jgi:hypothetical protein
MKKHIILAIALALVLSFSSLGGTQKAVAADWTSTGSIWTTYYHSGSFSSYVYQRTIKPSSGSTILAGVQANSSATGTFKAILQKSVNGVWQNYRTKYPTKNGYTALTFYDVTQGATYRIKLENTGSSKINYTFNVKQ